MKIKIIDPKTFAILLILLAILSSVMTRKIGMAYCDAYDITRDDIRGGSSLESIMENKRLPEDVQTKLTENVEQLEKYEQTVKDLFWTFDVIGGLILGLLISRAEEPVPFRIKLLYLGLVSGCVLFFPFIIGSLDPCGRSLMLYMQIPLKAVLWLVVIFVAEIAKEYLDNVPVR